MPRVNIYIRHEDWEAWLKIENKSQWVHEMLKPGLVGNLHEVSVDEIHDVTTSGELFFHTKTQNTCKNGHPIPDGRDRCLGKGCKYA